MDNEPVHTSTTRSRARKAAIWVAVSALTLLAIGVILTLSWRPDLPDPVAVRFLASGVPVGFAPLTSYIWAVGGGGAGVIVVLAGCCATVRRTLIRKGAAALAMWLGVFLAGWLVLTLDEQRGLDTAADTVLSLTPFGAALLAAFIAAAIAWRATSGEPRLNASASLILTTSESDNAIGSVNSVADPVNVSPISAWIRYSWGGPIFWAAASGVTLFAVLAIATNTWTMLLVPAILATVFSAMLVFQVCVDHTGLSVRSALTWPRTHISLNQIRSVDVVRISALREFGGWGWRAARDGRVGVVPRSGEAIRLHLTNGRIVVVVVTDAKAGAALISTHANRQATPTSEPDNASH